MKVKNTTSQMDRRLEPNFTGCLVGLAIGEVLGNAVKGMRRREISDRFGIVRDYVQINEEHHLSLTKPSGEITTQALIQAKNIIAANGKLSASDGESQFTEIIGQIIPIGLLNTYGRFEMEQFLLVCKNELYNYTGDPFSIQGGVVVAAAVRLVARQELLPEDLMSATLDYLPFGLPDKNPLYKKLLASQDYLEEHQTLVDNIQSGNLEVDLFRVDLNNMERCGVSDNLAETIAAAFYAFTSCKESFEEAVILAVNTGGKAANKIAAVTGALAGAYHGLEAIPERWHTGLSGYTEIVEIGQLLHKMASNRE
jgi:ADP-ribosylglycohydrolase